MLFFLEKGGAGNNKYFPRVELQYVNLKGKNYVAGDSRIIFIPALELAVTNGSGTIATKAVVYGERWNWYLNCGKM